MKHETVRFKTIGTYGMVVFVLRYLFVPIENIINKN